MLISLNGFGFMYINSQNICTDSRAFKNSDLKVVVGVNFMGGRVNVSVFFSLLTCIFLRMTLIKYQNKNLID